MNAHISGPWSTHLCDDTMIVDSDRKPVALLCGIYPPESEKMEARARLIAAAPDMIEALKSAVDCGLVPISSAKDGGANAHAKQVRVADQIRAAIAKATGAS